MLFALHYRTYAGCLLDVPVLSHVLQILPKYCTIAIEFTNLTVHRNGIERNCDGPFVSPDARPCQARYRGLKPDLWSRVAPWSSPLPGPFQNVPHACHRNFSRESHRGQAPRQARYRELRPELRLPVAPWPGPLPSLLQRPTHRNCNRESHRGRAPCQARYREL